MFVNFTHEWQDLQLTVDSERLIFENLLLTILLALTNFGSNLKYFSIFHLSWSLNSVIISNKPTQYLLLLPPFLRLIKIIYMHTKQALTYLIESYYISYIILFSHRLTVKHYITLFHFNLCISLRSLHDFS